MACYEEVVHAVNTRMHTVFREHLIILASHECPLWMFTVHERKDMQF